MAFKSKDGKSFTNRAPMMSHDRSMARQGGGGMMERTDPLKQPGDGGEDMDPNDKPMHTEHHPDGSHTTEHESGKAHDSENLDALKQHLDKFLGEEAQEPSEQGEPEYE